MDELTKAEIERIHDEDTRQNHRLDIVEGRLDQLGNITLSIERLTINMGHMVEQQKKMAEKQDQISEDLDAIKTKPAEAWDKAVWLVITGVISAIIGYLLKSIGL